MTRLALAGIKSNWSGYEKRISSIQDEKKTLSNKTLGIELEVVRQGSCRNEIHEQIGRRSLSKLSRQWAPSALGTGRNPLIFDRLIGEGTSGVTSRQPFSNKRSFLFVFLRSLTLYKRIIRIQEQRSKKVGVTQYNKQLFLVRFLLFTSLAFFLKEFFECNKRSEVDSEKRFHSYFLFHGSLIKKF